MIPRSLDFHIQKNIQAYEIFVHVQNFYISLDLLSQGHHTSGKVFFAFPKLYMCMSGEFFI